MAAITLAVVFNVAPKLVIAAEGDSIAPNLIISSGTETPIPVKTIDNSPSVSVPQGSVDNSPSGSVPQGPIDNSTSGSLPGSEFDTSAGGSLPNPTISTGPAGGMPYTQSSNGYEGVSVPVQAPSEPEQPAIVPAVTPSVFTGGGSSSSSGGGYSILSLASGTSSCPLITSYMKLGGNNNAGDVARVQAFLKTLLGINLAVTGKFDVATQDAIRVFQNRFLTEVMGPWGSNQASGYVYITTMKKINELSCNRPLGLNAADLKVISDFNSRAVAVQTVAPRTTISGTPGTDSNEIGPVLETGPVLPSASSSDEIGSVDGSSQTASVVNASMLSRFWNFITGLFR